MIKNQTLFKTQKRGKEIDENKLILIFTNYTKATVIVILEIKEKNVLI